MISIFCLYLSFKIAQQGAVDFASSLSDLEKDSTKSDYGGIFLMAQTVKHLPEMRETRVRSLGREDSPREGNGNPLQYSCLEYSMDGGPWWATVHRVTKTQTRLRDFTFFLFGGKESASQCRGYRFDPWTGKIPHASEQLSPNVITTEPGL